MLTEYRNADVYQRTKSFFVPAISAEGPKQDRLGTTQSITNQNRCENETFLFFTLFLQSPYAHYKCVITYIVFIL